MKAINLKNRSEKTVSALESAIKAAEGKASVRKISCDDIFDAVDEVEERLSISKKAMDGVIIYFDCNAQDFPNAYKYVPESTHFAAVYKNGSWRVTDIRRDVCNKKRICIVLTDTAKEAIIKNHTIIY